MLRTADTLSRPHNEGKREGYRPQNDVTPDGPRSLFGRALGPSGALARRGQPWHSLATLPLCFR